MLSPSCWKSEASRGQDQTPWSTADSKASPNHAAPRDLNAAAEGFTCKAICQMSLHRSAHPAATLLLSRADGNYPSSGVWGHLSTETERFIFAKAS